MKSKLILLALVAASAVCAGCKITHLKTPTITFTRGVMGTDEEFRGVEVEPTTNGFPRLKLDGYRSEQAESFSVMAEMFRSVAEITARAYVGQQQPNTPAPAPLQGRPADPPERPPTAATNAPVTSWAIDPFYRNLNIPFTWSTNAPPDPAPEPAPAPAP